MSQVRKDTHIDGDNDSAGRVMVLQSATQLRPAWLDQCLDSVKSWSRQYDYSYQFIGDELFGRVPEWYCDKLKTRTPIIADLARLLWIEAVLDSGEADTAVWLDSDVYIFAPDLLQIAPQTSCVFGAELWVQPEESASGQTRYRVRRNVHNAFCIFRYGCPFLPFLIEVTQRLIRRIDPAYIAPQIVGPKLLTSLHSLAEFELEPRVGALSAWVQRDLIDQTEHALAPMLAKQSEPLAAANLCASLSKETESMAQSSNPIERVIERLDEFRSGMK